MTPRSASASGSASCDDLDNRFTPNRAAPGRSACETRRRAARQRHTLKTRETKGIRSRVLIDTSYAHCGTRRDSRDDATRMNMRVLFTRFSKQAPKA